MNKSLISFVFGTLGLCALVGFWFVQSEIHSSVSKETLSVTFDIKPGESVSEIGNRLEEEGVIRSASFFKRYVVWKEIDTKIQAGTFTVDAPVTLARVAEVLGTAGSGVEKTITIIPGWTVRQIADYLESEDVGDAEDILRLTGLPAVQYSGVGDTLGIAKEYDVLQDKPMGISYEGYFRPDTYRIFADATAEEVLERLVRERDKQFTDQMYADIKKAGRSVHEVMTMASIVEKEVRGTADRKMVADLFWRRYDANWGLQADSTVHYVVGKDGSVFTTQADRETDNPWNTYKYAGLPPGPISNPSLDAIMATIYPTPNTYNYFLTTLDTGEVKYAETLDGHNLNRARYLR